MIMKKTCTIDMLEFESEIEDLLERHGFHLKKGESLIDITEYANEKQSFLLSIAFKV